MISKNKIKPEMRSKIKPHLEFVTDDKYLDEIGIHPIGLRSRAWHTKKSVQKYILKLRKEIDFYQELYAQFGVVDKMISETKTK